VCVQPSTAAGNETLLAFAADRHAAAAPLLLGAGRAAIERYLLPARPTAANSLTLLQQSTAGTDRQTDTRTVTQILLHTVKQYQRCWFKQISVITFAFRCSTSAAGAFRRIAMGHLCFARAAGFVCDRLVTTNMSHFRSIF